MSRLLQTVSDSNVLIDIEDGELTNALFSLANIHFFVPDVLFEQELRTGHSHLIDLGLNICSLSGTSVAEVFELAQKYRKVSRIDLFALQLAKEKSALLLTGDKALSKVAKEFKIECHGTVWLVEQIIQEGIIQISEAEEAYRRMRAAGSRLPWEEAEQRLIQMAGVGELANQPPILSR